MKKLTWNLESIVVWGFPGVVGSFENKDKVPENEETLFVSPQFLEKRTSWLTLFVNVFQKLSAYFLTSLKLRIVSALSSYFFF